MKVSIYQSYYKDEQTRHLSPYCIPYDNTANETPEFREYPQMKRVAELAKADNSDYWGLISWKFKQKCLIDPRVFHNTIGENLGYDVYFVNPCYIIESFFPNPWAHGEWHHKGITQMAYDGLKLMGVNEPEHVLTSLYPRDRMLFCNYFVGNDKFWNGFFAFIDTFFTTSGTSEDLYNRIYSPAGYSGDAQLHNFIFLVERLVSTYLVIKTDLKVLNYEYTYEDQASKIVDISDFNSVRLQSDLKKEAFYRPHNSKTEAFSAFNRAMFETKQHLIHLE